MRSRNQLWIQILFMVIILPLVNTGCAWFRGEKEPEALVKPIPEGGYASLSNRIHYPREVREANIEGTVAVNALISPTGVVLETRVVRPLHPELDRIVTNAIKRTPFIPATRGGRPEQVWISIPFVFALKDWADRSTPFNSFVMTIHPDPAYKHFQVEVTTSVKPGFVDPLRLECLLPFNATDPWVRTPTGKKMDHQIVRDDNGEWLIFQTSEPQVKFGFAYRSLSEVLDHKFIYEFTMNQSLPDWELHVIYGEQSVNFSQPPDRTEKLPDGATRFVYELEGQDVYESRFLEIDLQR